MRTRPRVSLNFDGNGQGGEVLVLTGDAEVLPHFPPAHENKPYADKYAERIGSVFGTTEEFARKYPMAMRIRITRVR